MQNTKDQMTQIRWHGRGGQGAITAAKIVAEAAFRSGYGGAVMAPTFGTERRGAPVTTSLKIAHNKIYDLSPITTPDIVVVLDYMILYEVDVTAGLKPGGWIILNSRKEPVIWATTNYVYVMGPLKRFGNLLVSDWATTNNGLVRYQMVSLTGSNQRPDLALFARPEEHRQ